MKDYTIELYKVLKVSKNNKESIFNLLDKRIKSNPMNVSELKMVLLIFKLDYFKTKSNNIISTKNGLSCELLSKLYF
tara:strand:+ start:1386 stop:1616 length:231 start_codon:yes stop_codon:yes gene_type:complete